MRDLSFSLVAVLLIGSFMVVLNAQDSAVRLEWDPNSETDLAGYSIYRSDRSGSGYVRMNQNLITSSAYTDDGIEAGQFYYYVCTATDTSDLESAYSNEVEYSYPAELFITEISPAIASPNTRISIKGSGFSSGSAEVRFNGVLGTDVQLISDSEIMVTVPDLPPGPVEVSVSVASGSGSFSAFSITDAVLTICYVPQFADGAFQTLRFQSTLILANSGADSWVDVQFYRFLPGQQARVPMEITLGNLGTDSVFEFPLLQGESVSLATPGTGEMQVGYARIQAGEGVGGVVVFQRTDLPSGVSLFEAGVPVSKELDEFSLFIDSLGDRDTGFAIVYPLKEETGAQSEQPDASVSFRLYDKDSNLIATTEMDMVPGTHLAQYANQLFDDPEVKAQAQEMQGILAVVSDQPLVAVTVRQSDAPLKEFPQEVPILTTFPVIPGAPD